MNIKDMQIGKAESSLCSGFRWKEDCPHNGEFDSDSRYCEECYVDAMKAMTEVTIDIIKEENKNDY